jgi:hypothetical protein
MLPHTSANMSKPPKSKSAPKAGAKRKREESSQPELMTNSLKRLATMKQSDEESIKLMQQRITLLDSMLACKDFTQHVGMMPALNRLSSQVTEHRMKYNTLYENQKKAVVREERSKKAVKGAGAPLSL